MTTMQIKDAKLYYRKTGRLNRNIIRDEISISWYKCRLAQIDHSINLSSIHFNKKNILVSEFQGNFITFIDAIVPLSMDYYLINPNLDVVTQRTSVYKIDSILSFEEHLLGTNAAALSYKSGKQEHVLFEEHYLDGLSNFCTYGIPIKQEDRIIGILMLLSDFEISPYEISNVRRRLNAYSENKAQISKENFQDYSLSELFHYPPSYFRLFKSSIERIQINQSSVLIKGSCGSGRTTLALYLATGVDSNALYMDASAVPSIYQYRLLKSYMYQTETLVVDNIELLSDNCIKLLTVYNREKIINKNSKKFSDMKVLNIILTTVNKTDFKGQILQLTEDLKLMTVTLKNLDDFESDEVLSITGDHRYETFKHWKDSANSKTQAELIESLEDHERAYIVKVLDYMNYNITASAEILKIGRSTLYRKMQKYQIDTNPEISK
ncbi:helix-turn-helix domain-containing protein [Fusibacter tunisiensis]|uniref:DNA-binding protein Fis n=1 Tax=Fusibacter tunisiensis TaxID=1008308 RepID=A0ABS2MNL0_9FIRM|nr:helix-turn-helix domain-containing protein [Fusibacter tunisiensis]MBM7560993.1 DNA-binding protein Fis [Fusibacter tunisiensis]